MSDEIVAAIIGGFFATVSALGAVMLGHHLSRSKRLGQSSGAEVATAMNAHVTHQQIVTNLDNTTRQPSADLETDESNVIAIPKLVAGFLIAILAALFWGVGNAVTRWTAMQFPESSFDVALLKYSVAGASLIAIGSFRAATSDVRFCASTLFPHSSAGMLFKAGLAKGLNTYLWIVAVAFVSATTVSTLENMHVIWTALFLGVFFRVRVLGSWVASAVIVVIGAALVTGVATQGFGQANILGLSLGLVAGISFSVFTIIWTGEGQRPARFSQRANEMGLFLILCAILVYPIHLIARNWLGGAIVPLQSLPFKHAFVQGVNGLVGIGLTYLLMNESLALMHNAGRLASLLLSLGISFAVVFTLATEAIWFGQQIMPYQWLGIVLFTIGFTSVRSSIMKLKADSKAS